MKCFREPLSINSVSAQNHKVILIKKKSRKKYLPQVLLSEKPSSALKQDKKSCQTLCEEIILNLFDNSLIA